MSGRSSGVEHNLAKVGVEGSNPFARSINSLKLLSADRYCGGGSRSPGARKPPLYCGSACDDLKIGAGDEIRTHDPNLGKVVLYP